MNRRIRMFVSITACLGLLALAGAAQAAGNAKLLARFQPVTSFDSAENFRPTSVETFVSDSDLERFNPSTGNWVVVDPNPDAATLPPAKLGGA
jgi:hypothetical protein